MDPTVLYVRVYPQLLRINYKNHKFWKFIYIKFRFQNKILSLS